MPFGKDLGLVHEAVIMSRKVGADETFWAALAHDGRICRVVIPLALHANIIKQYFVPYRQPVKDQTKELGEWLYRVLIYSPADYGKGDVDIRLSKVSAEELNFTDLIPTPEKVCLSDAATISFHNNERLRKEFFSQLFARIRDMGLHTLELCAVLPTWEERSRAKVCCEEASDEFVTVGLPGTTGNELLAGVRRIIAQRTYLREWLKDF